MSSIITRVILPGIGPVCPECFSRGHIAASPLSPKEVYSFGVTEPEAQLDWDVDAARKLRDRKDCWAFRLSEEEQRSICIYRREGRMAELPTFPSPGVTDLDAGGFLSFASEYDVA